MIFALLGLALLAVATMAFRATRSNDTEAAYYQVKRGDFLISIVEGGTLEAVREQVIRNEVEGTARIIFIVPEGSTVKKGDLLVELDSSTSQDAVNQQQINVEKAQFAVVQAQQQLEIQKSTAASDISAAELKKEFAESDLKKYIEGELEQSKRNAQIDITNVMETLEINKDRFKWTEELYKQGYETKANLDKDRLSVSQTALKLEQAQKALWMIETFDIPKKKRELEALLEEAKLNLETVKMQSQRRIAQYEADLKAQKSTYDLSKAKLERDVKQLAATKIYAPQDGLVVYATGGGGGRFSSESMIEEGAVVRNRQELIKLPDISEMKLQVKIHESHINQVQIGQPAYVVLDAKPDHRFRGVVTKVAPLPDSSARWGNPNLKVYATDILVTDKLPDVKPGVSARAEVVVTTLEKVLTVPIQAITTYKGQQVAYVAGTTPQPVPVKVGLYNTKFIEVTSGLKEGDRILLSPPFDSQGKDLANAVIADGEKLPEMTNTARPNLAASKRTVERGIPAALPGSDPQAASAMRRMGDMNNGDLEQGNGGALSERPRGMNRGNRNSGEEDNGGNAASGERRLPGFGEGGLASQGAPGGPLNREEMVKQFDTNGDGQLDETERTAMRQRFGQRSQGAPGGQFNREEMMKQFDTNGDGELDETERAAMRERFGRGRNRPGGSTNSVNRSPAPDNGNN